MWHLRNEQNRSFMYWWIFSTNRWSVLCCENNWAIFFISETKTIIFTMYHSRQTIILFNTDTNNRTLLEMLCSSLSAETVKARILTMKINRYISKNRAVVEILFASFFSLAMHTSQYPDYNTPHWIVRWIVCLFDYLLLHWY